jgi:hypothetical protein
MEQNKKLNWINLPENEKLEVLKSLTELLATDPAYKETSVRPYIVE